MRLLIALAGMLAAGPALAQAHPNYQLATDLATVLVSEELCDLSYDPKAIQAFIKERVPPDDLMFATDLGVLVRLSERNIGEMSASHAVAHCAQVSQVAEHFGFLAR